MKTILLVEDDLNLGALYEEELSEAGYHMLRAGNGSDALKQMAQHHLDLMVLELNLPGNPPGMDVMEQMLAAQPGLMVIINSGYDSYKDSFRSWSASAFVSKSSDLSELKSQIRQVLASQESSVPVLPESKGRA